MPAILASRQDTHYAAALLPSPRAPASLVSATIRSLSSIDQRRRGSPPAVTSSVPPLTDRKLSSIHRLKVKRVRHLQ